MTLIHNASCPGKVRPRPLMAGLPGIEKTLKFRGFQAIYPLLAASHPPRLVFCSGCPLCLISLLLKEAKLGDQWKSGKRSCARVAERQTRWLQVPVSERVWGFKSPLAHAIESPRSMDRGLFCCPPTQLGDSTRPNQASLGHVLSPGWVRATGGQSRAEPVSRRRELLRWRRMAAAAATGSRSAIAA